MLLSAGLACAGLAACSAPPPPAAAARGNSAGAPAAHALERFLPLLNDTVFTYNVWLPGQASPELLILEVERPGPERARMKSGSSVKRLEFAADGVRLLTGGYLLKQPLSLGASWAGPAGQVQVTALDQAVSVPAGNFVGCVETTENAGRAPEQRTIVTSYCPDVGIVRFSVEGGSEEQRFELKTFGERVDINAL